MTDFISLIAQVRRAMPRNPSVMALCDGFEQLLASKPARAPATSSEAIALERLRATKRKAQKAWYHGPKAKAARAARRRAEKGAQ